MKTIEVLVDPRLPQGVVVAATGMSAHDDWTEATEILVMRIRDRRTVYHRIGTRILVTFRNLDL